MLQKFIDHVVQILNGFTIYQIVGAIFFFLVATLLFIILHPKKDKQPKTEKAKVKKVKRPKKEKPSLTVEETIACLRRKRDDPRRYGPIRHGFKYY